MSGQDDLVSSLYAAVLAGAGQEGGVSGQSYVCLEWPGLPIEAADFGNALTAENPAGSPAALEAFSTLVDEVPALSPVYQETGVSLQTVYGMILEATVSGGSAATRAFADAKERFDAQVRGSLNDPLAVYHPAYASPRTWADPVGAAQWTTVQVGGGTTPPPPPPPILRPVLAGELNKLNWRFSGETPPIVVRTPPPAALTGERVAVARAAPGIEVARAAPGIEVARAAPGTAAATATLKVNPEPLTLAKRAAIPALVARPAMSLQMQRLATTTLRPASVPPTLATHAALPASMVQRFAVQQVAPQATPVKAPEEQPAGSNGLGITLQMLHIGIERPWFDPIVTHLSGWSLDGVERGFFSNGQPDNNPGLCPLVPTSVIAIRNTRITGNWSQPDRTAAARAMSNAKQSAFGPFTLSVGGRTQGSFDGTTLSIPGIQIIAWICSRMPVLPP